MPPRTWRERAEQWVQWVGPGRLVGSAVVALAVLAGAYWLVKPPAATTESRLPMAHSSASGGANPSTTLLPVASASSSTVVQQIVVHVAGAVVQPGVYMLGPGTRVVDAVRAAGGFSADADPNAVNLAALVADGQRVYITRVGEAAPPAGGDTSGSEPFRPVNINTATVDELDELPGVGPATAAAIVAHRGQHGPFSSIEQLAEVRGIGPVKLDALRGLVTV